ncbi:MAG: NfeD family protein [Brasilonema octagenarum HA4186-MV1]|jgi:membrane protein implicated in regulation of membrane protease activity|nr:NfeD family protein [Brasilonema octagenarum HA4186-MV1]
MPSTTLIWLLAGSGLCLLELFMPTAFAAFLAGISALVVAFLSQTILGKLWLQIVVWLFLSTVLVVLSRRFITLPKRKTKIQHAIIAETLTEIPAGKPGRVLYEGNSWRARCDDETLSISPNQRVYVTGREGTTLIVMPENLLDS